MKKLMMIYLVALVVLTVSLSAEAVVIDDGQVHIIDYTINDHVDVSGVGTHVTLVDGGYIGGFLRSYTDGQITVLGGYIDGGLFAVSSMPMILSGGIIGGGIGLDSGSGGDLTIIGSDFKVDGIAVPYGMYISTSNGHITGTLLSGDLLDNDFWYAGANHIIFATVPEPEPNLPEWSLEAKLTALDGAAGDYLGLSVSVDGDYAIAGTPLGDNDDGQSSGSAYIFKHDVVNWGEQVKLITLDGETNDWFGASVCIDGDYAIVGAPGDDDNGMDSGAVYIFKRKGVNWVKQAKLIASDGQAEDYFGGSVSIDGDYLVVGADGCDNDTGTAYIFKRVGSNWIEQAKLTASDGEAEDYFGWSVSLSGNYAIIGASGNDSSPGGAYIFKLDGTNWVEQAKLAASDGEAEDFFGSSVSLNGDYAIAGAHGDNNNTGSAYIFKREGENWIEQAKLTASDGEVLDWFGRGVSINGDYVVVGSSYDDYGSVYIFKREGAIWVEEIKLTASDGELSDYFGNSVSMDGANVIVGAYGDDDYTGSVYIFTNEFTYHVDAFNGNDDDDGWSMETAFATIGRGIEAAEDGDTVLVWPGVYAEAVEFLGKAITVRSASDAAVIEGVDEWSDTVSFYQYEEANSVLKNFIIRDSYAGVFVRRGSPTISNVTFVNNLYGIEASAGSSPDVSNCIFWDNLEDDLLGCEARFSCIERGGTGIGNIDSEPLFADANGGDYHLLSERGRYWPAIDMWVLDDVTSPCIDAGDLLVDYSSERMPNGGRINVGAYGGTGYAGMNEKIWLAGDINRDDVVNMLDFAMFADNWLGVYTIYPEVTIISPEDGDFIDGGQITTIEADAWDVDGRVVEVRFFIDDILIGVDEDGSDGWSIDWDPNYFSGYHGLTAAAIDNDGAETVSEPVAIEVSTSPITRE